MAEDRSRPRTRKDRPRTTDEHPVPNDGAGQNAGSAYPFVECVLEAMRGSPVEHDEALLLELQKYAPDLQLSAVRLLVAGKEKTVAEAVLRVVRPRRWFTGCPAGPPVVVRAGDAP